MKAVLSGGLGDETVLDTLRAALACEPDLLGGIEGPEAVTMIDESTEYGDPYQWSSSDGALAFLSTERGVLSPGDAYLHPLYDAAWARVAAKLAKVGGFIEPVNGGVSLVWPA